MAGVQVERQSGGLGAGDQVLALSKQVDRRGRWRWWLGAFVLAAYLLTASGHVQTIDAQQEIQVASRLFSRHGLSIRSFEFQGGGTQPGRDGKQYSAHDLGMSLVYAPLVLLPGAVGPNGEPTELMTFAAGLLDAVIGAAAVLCLADLLGRLGVDRRAAALGALAFAFATMQWVYAHIAFDVTANALAILVAVWAVVRARTGSSTLWLFIGATALGLAVTIRTDTLLLVPCISLPVLVGIWGVRRRTTAVMARALAWGLPIIVGTALNAWYNWFRFGSIFNNGHSHDPLLRTTTPIGVGLAGQLVSPGKGILFFSPFVLIALAGWPVFVKREPLLAGTLATTIVTNLVFHARLADWSGAEAWGSRHTMPVLALLMLPTAYVFEAFVRIRAHRSAWRHRLAAGGVAALAVIGAAVQLTAVGVDYLPVNRLRSPIRPGHVVTGWQALNWRPGESQIWLGAEALGRSIEGRAPYPDEQHGGVVPAPVPRFDLWWVRELTAGRRVLGATLAPALLAIAAAATAFGLVKATRDDTPTSPEIRSKARHAPSGPWES